MNVTHRCRVIRTACLLGLAGLLAGSWQIAHADGPGERLTSKPSVKSAPLPTVAIGEEIRTEAGQRRRVSLGANITLFANQNTVAKHTAALEISLSAGEVYVEAQNFTIKTGQRQVRLGDGKAAVRVDKQGTAVLVTRGEVTIAGLEKPVRAGWQLAAGALEPTPMPRASHVLDWTKDLLAAAASPLVPGSQYDGGALVARDPDGQDAKISLRKFHIDVHIEDGFARTTIDQTYFNQESIQLEGTFYFPLPSDASLSRLAMYVDGTLREGGMAEREHARNVYETIRYANRDPALLEWVDGSTFKMRVFPLEPRTEKRIILSYTQRLPALYGQTTYRFPAGHSMQKVDQGSVNLRVKGSADLAWESPSHKLQSRLEGGDLILAAATKNAATNRDLVLSLTAKSEPEASATVFSSTVHEGAQYLMLRFRPHLKINNPQSKIKNPLWVFLFESSGDRDPLLGRVQIEVIRNLLTHVDPKDTFLVATAGTRVKFHAAKPQTASPANVEAAVRFLEETHLIGALDLGSALQEISKQLPAMGETYLVHVGSGIPALGERRAASLIQMLCNDTRYVGVGVGRRWNRTFMKAAADKTGGHFAHINPDEPIAWRAFDLFATLDTPRLMNVQVEAEGGLAFLVFNQSIAQGEEICAVTRVGPVALPKSLRIRGLADGKPVEYKVAVKDVSIRADYLPRTWAKLEIDRLLAEDALRHKDTIVALSKAMYVVTPFTSLLVLEHEDLYTQYKVDRGRKDHWAMYLCPEKIPVIYEPKEGEADPKALEARKKQPAAYVVKTVLSRDPPQLLKGNSKDVADLIKQYRRLSKEGRFTEALSAARMAKVLDPDNLAADAAIQIAIIQTNSSIGHGNEEFLLRGLNGANGPFVEMKRRNIDSERLRVLALEPTIAGRDSADPAFAVNDSVIASLAPQFAIKGRPSSKVGQIFIAGGDLQDRPFAAPPAPVGLPLAPPLGFRFEHESNVSEDLRQMKGEWNRFWMVDQANPFTFNRVHGGITDRESSDGKLRRSYAAQDSIFFDLLAYAPGMNTSQADLEAVLAEEALPSRSITAGKIDAGARELLDKARLTGWHTWTIPGNANQPGVTITLDGTGRYVYERTLPLGIKERVVCDGQTLVHLYPQLFVGAKRSVSRFHRADFAERVPWYLPPAEDMAHGVDLKVIAGRTVALVPHFEAKILEKIKDLKDVSWLRRHLVFGEDGKLAERQLVKMPEQLVLVRQILEKDGTLRLLDKDGTEVAVRRGKLTPIAKAPNVAPDTKNLVVLPLPYRTAEHVQRTLKNSLAELRLAEALPLFAAHIAAGNANEANNVFRQCFHAREQRQLGYYVLLAACGVNLDAQNADVLAEHLDEPLAQYLALHSSPVLRKHASQWALASVSWNEGFLQHLSLTHALYQRWQDGKVVKGDPARVRADRQKALAYVRANKGSAFGFALLCLMQDRAGEDKDFHGELAESWRLFEESPVLGYAARYEFARSLYKSGQVQEARKHFQDLYTRTFKEDTLPAIDQDFRWALVGKEGESDTWNTLMRDTASRLVRQKLRPAVLALARQCWHLGDEPLANTLLAVALEHIEDAKETTAMTLAGTAFLEDTNQIAAADDKLRQLAADKELAQKPGLWRMGVRFADQRDLPDRALECLEQALENEFRNLPEVVDLNTVRADYGRLLEHYEKLAEAMVILKVKPSSEFLAKVVRAADRWRALDRDSADPSTKAAWILQRLGDRELGWDYLTTPVALKPSEAEPWLGMARTLVRKGDLALAERAYKAASEAEPTSAQILWDRAQNLRRAGKEREAQSLFRRIADGTWQPRFQGLVNQARAELAR
jgi:tetratricopeptide (TPR) repeat protein